MRALRAIHLSCFDLAQLRWNQLHKPRSSNGHLMKPAQTLRLRINRINPRTGVFLGSTLFLAD